MSWRLDCLGRLLRDLINWMRYLDAKGMGLQGIYEAIDTTMPMGRLTFHLAEFAGGLAIRREEAANCYDRNIQAGLAAALARGRLRIGANP